MRSFPKRTRRVRGVCHLATECYKDISENIIRAIKKEEFVKEALVEAGVLTKREAVAKKKA